jgi:hypothetical protein
MLINTLASALPSDAVLSNAVPSNAMLAAAAQAGAVRPLAVSGPGAAVCAGTWIGGGYPVATGGGADKATGGNAPGFVEDVRPPKVRFDATYGSNVQSTVQHNTMTRLTPVLPGGVGPHPARERAPA